MKGHMDASEQLMQVTDAAMDRLFGKTERAAAESIAETLNLRGELERAKKKLEQAECLLNEALEYFEERYDVGDGDEGKPEANREMSLGMSIDEFLNGKYY